MRELLNEESDFTPPARPSPTGTESLGLGLRGATWGRQVWWSGSCVELEGECTEIYPSFEVLVNGVAQWAQMPDEQHRQSCYGAGYGYAGAAGYGGGTAGYAGGAGYGGSGDANYGTGAAGYGGAGAAGYGSGSAAGYGGAGYAGAAGYGGGGTGYSGGAAGYDVGAAGYAGSGANGYGGGNYEVTLHGIIATGIKTRF